MGSGANASPNSPFNQAASGLNQIKGPTAASTAPMGMLMGMAGGEDPQQLQQNLQSSIQNSGLVPGQPTQPDTQDSGQTLGQPAQPDIGTTTGANGNTVVGSVPSTMLGSQPQPGMLATVPPSWNNPITAAPPVMPTSNTFGAYGQSPSTPNQFTPFFFGSNPFGRSSAATPTPMGSGLGANMQY